MSLLDARTPSVVHPPAPVNLAEAGLTLDLVVQLVVKTLHFAGELTGSDIAGRIGLNFPVVEPAIDELIRQHHCEIAPSPRVNRGDSHHG